MLNCSSVHLGDTNTFFWYLEQTEYLVIENELKVSMFQVIVKKKKKIGSDTNGKV